MRCWSERLRLVCRGCQITPDYPGKHLFAQIWNVLGTLRKPRGVVGEDPKERHKTVMKPSRATGLCSFKVKDV